MTIWIIEFGSANKYAWLYFIFPCADKYNYFLCLCSMNFRNFAKNRTESVQISKKWTFLDLFCKKSHRVCIFERIENVTKSWLNNLAGLLVFVICLLNIFAQKIVKKIQTRPTYSQISLKKGAVSLRNTDSTHLFANLEIWDAGQDSRWKCRTRFALKI